MDKYFILPRRSKVLKLLVPLGSALLLLAFSSRATPPAPPSNTRVISLPAEVFLTWDASPDAAEYAVFRSDFRAAPDRRWTPIAMHLTGTRFRDPDFTTLPCYYRVVVYNGLGETSTTADLLAIDPWPTPVGIMAAYPRPISDNAYAIAFYELTSP